MSSLKSLKLKEELRDLFVHLNAEQMVLLKFELQNLKSQMPSSHTVPCEFVITNEHAIFVFFYNCPRNHQMPK